MESASVSWEQLTFFLLHSSHALVTFALFLAEESVLFRTLL